MDLLWILTLVTVVAVLIFAVRVSIFLYRCPRLIPAHAALSDAPLVSIVVPARNEAASIERCVSSLLAQNYPAFEAIVVDDGSTDATPTILQRLAATDERLRVVRNDYLPRGWTGKNYAIVQGVRHARGAWLLFVDADMLLHPGALSAALEAARQHGAALLSVWARQETVGFWERVVQPVIVGLLQAVDPWQHINSLRFRKVAMANGQFLLAERTAYEQIGGHAAVRDAVVDDHALAWRFKSAGHALLMMDGTRAISTRMYTSLRGIWDGWSKHSFLTIERNLLVALGGALAVFFVAVSPFLLTCCAALMLLLGWPALVPLLCNAGAVGVLLINRWRARGYAGTLPRDYLWHALGGLVFAGIILNSAYQYTLGHGVRWKGRRYREADTVA
jgi:chlorobactene glucosyltransferase